MASYAKLPELKELTKKLLKEVGVTGFFKLYKSVIPTKLKIAFKNSGLMDELMIPEVIDYNKAFTNAANATNTVVKPGK